MSATFWNILAATPVPRPSLLVAHYDSVTNSRGAGDDGAAVAALLETARIVMAGPKLRRSIFILFTDAEEVGLLGALAFVHEHPLAQRAGIVIKL